MSQNKMSGRNALLRAVSVLGISLGISAVALAEENPKETIGSQSSGAGSGKVSNQYKADYVKHGPLDSHQLKYDSNQIKGESHQLKLDSVQHKQTVGHALNPQPLPPG